MREIDVNQRALQNAGRAFQSMNRPRPLVPPTLNCTDINYGGGVGTIQCH